jgi:hypothetical protein
LDRIVKGLAILVVIAVSLYYLVDAIYALVYYASDYFTYKTPLFRTGKITVIILVICLFLLRIDVLRLTDFGKKTLRVFALVTTIIFIGSFFWYSATDEGGVTVQKPWGKSFKGWEKVDKITTSADYQVTYNSTKSDTWQPVIEYRIHFKDGSSINAWDDIRSISRLDEFIRSRGIPIEYGKINPNIARDLERYVDGDPEKARKILHLK